jgi:hypothetical protein
MRHLLTVIFCAILCDAVAGAAPEGNDAGAISVNHHWQLFLDDYIIARATGFDRVLHHPRARGIVIPADKPWETLATFPIFISRREDSNWMAFYGAMYWTPGVYEGQPHADRAHQYANSTAYATSRDGIHWEKPNLGLVEAPAATDWEKNFPLPTPNGVSKENNLGVPFMIRDLGQYGNIKDPARRYAISYKGKAYFSPEIPDFLRDPNWVSKLVEAGGTFSPRGAALDFWDDQHEEWVGIAQNAVPHWMPAREIARFTSKDLVRWTSDIVLCPDPADPHVIHDYQEPMSMLPFFTDSVVLGLLSWFHSDRRSPDGGPVLQKSAEYPNIWPWARKGVNEMRITFSRDGGRTWNRTCSREAWIPHGTEEDSYDRLVITPSLPVRVGDEDWFYMGLFNGDHLTTRSNAKQDSYYNDRLRKGEIALYTQKHNRYVSLRAPILREIPVDPKLRPAGKWLSASEPQPVLITKPLILTGKTLQLNVEANRGMVRVAIAAAEPIETLKGTTLSMAPHFAELHPLSGFSFDDCVPVRVNSIEHNVQFKNDATLDSLSGRKVRLLFEMIDANLYGFRVSQGAK